ncbi:hypothetical protein BDK51DRAFT_31171 [Blyttiomyces helicus]|uniref:Uncharacterized protein n=1 Tax=Blyttiomyces helicus TaxID=388810 RepID=A0A4P9VY37_9FUNG|nr:hypothetical protein BDK51DRAFT_31171 [Blyttiomyces helicus]|eukprot:RKO83208.1 hypothetical protein BDK51DRAFT_31171 [Blyttiomyces helicus]
MEGLGEANARVGDIVELRRMREWGRWKRRQGGGKIGGSSKHIGLLNAAAQRDGSRALMDTNQNLRSPGCDGVGVNEGSRELSVGDFGAGEEGYDGHGEGLAYWWSGRGNFLGGWRERGCLFMDQVDISQVQRSRRALWKRKNKRAPEDREKKKLKNRPGREGGACVLIFLLKEFCYFFKERTLSSRGPSILGVYQIQRIY